jgi:diguanylate cyclase (GGDEF)-like protein
MVALSFTISLGVSVLDKGDSDIESAIIKADKALYIAKENGRNMVSSF